MEEKLLSFSYQARYYKVGTISTSTKAIWFVLHGYGQLAKYFISKFKILEDHDICVIAPEGLSKFYLENLTTRAQSGDNRVGATWMTRENRLTDIENYLTYLTSIYKNEVTHSHIPVTILGFSQGAATASRWAISDQVQFTHLVLWAGIFPPDMDFKKGKEVLTPRKVSIVYGANDPFLTDTQFNEMKSLSDRMSLKPTTITFEGGHELQDAALLRLL